MPELERLRPRYEAQGIAFLAVSLETDPGLVRSAADSLGLRMPIALAQGEVLGPLGVRALPSTVFVDPDGVMVAAATGERGGRFLENRLRGLVARSQGNR